MSETNGRALTAAEIFAKDDLELERIDIPEWDGCVYVRVMTGIDRDLFDKRREDNQPFRAWLLSRCVTDETGKPLFNQTDGREMSQIGAKSGKAIDRIIAKLLELNALDGDAVDELAGN